MDPKIKIKELTNSEEAWVSAQIEGAIKFVNIFSPGDAGKPLSLAGLDRAFAAAVASGQTDNGLINTTINFVGVAFGRFLVEGIGLRWVIATDEYGTDLAAYGLPDAGDVLVYPANFVAKRWDRREAYFLERSFSEIKSHVEEMGRQWAKPSA